MPAQMSLIPSPDRSLVPATLERTVQAWADARTDPASDRRADLLHDKAHAVLAFFESIGKPPDQVRPQDVKAWQAELEARHLAPATVYALVSRVSSFYRWALKDSHLAGTLRGNPVNMARPKAPQPYQTSASKSLSDEDVDKLLRTVRKKADAGELVAKRDYAMLLLYVLTGRRREEIARLRWGDLKMGKVLQITARVKGGELVTQELKEKHVRIAVVEYLSASGRLPGMKASTPLWTRHDRAGQPGPALTSHAFSANLKRYAAMAGIGPIHVHQTRHTFARIVAEEAGSLPEVQGELGHKNLQTTRVYVQRVGVKKDRYSEKVAERFGF